MNRRLLVFLVCVPVAFAQRSRTHDAANKPAQAQSFDVTVTSAAGNPVPGLTAADFELTQAGQSQKIDSVTWFDPARHPAECRNFVLLVDDLGLTPARAGALQQLLRAFVDEQLAPDDRAVILRTSSGAGWLQQVGTDRKPLLAQIERIQPLGRGISPNALASAVWQTIRWAAEGLRTIPGRKAVVVVSERLDAPLVPGADPQYIRTSLRSQAHAAEMVLYTVNPAAPAEPPLDSALAWLIKETGGLPAPDLAAVARDQQGFYTLSFHPSSESNAANPVALALHGKILNLRWRAGFLSDPDTPRAPVPPTRAAVVDHALRGATTAGDLQVRVTPIFTGFTRNTATIDVVLYFGGHGLSDLIDLKGMHQLIAEIQLAAYSDSGRVTGPPGRGYDMFLTDTQLEKAREEGLVYTTRLTVPRAGAYQVRAAVIDGLSDRIGSAMHFLEIPAVDRGAFAIGGLTLKTDTPSKAGDGIRPAQDLSATDVFKPGSPIAFSYGLFNSTLGPAKESRLRVRTAIYATARQVYTGQPVDLEFPPATTNVRQVNGKVQLDTRLSPGEYVLEIEVTDLLANADPPRVAYQYATFAVR